MFDKTIIIPQNYREINLNFGEVAESILFYNQVNLYLKDLNLDDLIRVVPIEFLIELIENHGLRIFYTKNHLQIHQRQHGSNMQIGIGHISNKLEKHELIEVILKKHHPDIKRLSKFVQKLDDRIQLYTHPENITNQILDDFLSKEYADYVLNKTVTNNEVLKYLDIKFFRDSQKKYLYSCNYLDRLDIKGNKGNVPGLEKVFDSFVHAREQLLLASNENSSISTAPLIADFMNYKTTSIIKSHFNEANFEAFKDSFLPDFAKISESINHDSMNLKEYIKVLEKAKGFKHWLNGADENTNLISDFYQKSTEDSWIDKLPSKGTRFAIFTGAGFILDAVATGGIGTAIGTALGAGDTFLLDKFLNNWKPNFQLNQGYNAIKRFIK